MMMKLCLALAAGAISVSAWVSTTPSRLGQFQQRQPFQQHVSGRSSRRWAAEPSSSDLSSTDFLNDKKWEFLLNNEAQSSPTSNSRRPSPHRIVLASQEHDQAIILASSTYAESTSVEEGSTSGDAVQTSESAEADPYASAFDSEMEKMQTYAERVEKSNQASSFGDRLAAMDLQDIVSTLIIPAIALFAAGRWAFNRVATRVGENTDATLDSFTREMIYHDGDFDEMKLCFQDYSRKLVLLGPSKTDTMLKAYLEDYAKKKTVSPQAIVSLSYVFTLAKLSEERVAELLVSLCRRMGAEKVSSSGKLLFLGSRILKTPEGRRALEPIKDLIKGTYRDATVAESLVETSQQAIAEASYKACVQAAGKKQTSLTVGWETLGLDIETAQRIYGEEAKEGFVSDREAMYGGQTQKYDKKGRRLNKDGTLEDPAEADAAAKEKEEEESVSNVYECSECGYTLFVAQGRESKFFGTGFTCPECGAPKDKFEARDDFGED